MSSLKKVSLVATLLVGAGLGLVAGCKKDKNAADPAAEEMAKPDDKMGGGDMAKPDDKMGGGDMARPDDMMGKPAENMQGEMAKPDDKMGSGK